jgi:hypothetical protein
MLVGTVAALVGWIAWAAMTYVIGTQLLPEPQTNANLGQLLRTIGFAGVPGFFRILSLVPVLRWLFYAVVSIWLLAAMVVAVRQALDYRSTIRAISVCAIGWLVSTAVAFVFLAFFGPTVY